MAVFTYEAVDNKGKKVKADVEASNTQDAINKVHKMGLFPTTVKPKGNAAAAAAEAAGKMGKKVGKKSMFMGGVSQKDLTTFTVQLSILQDAGLPLVRSLKILEGQLKPCLLKTITEQVADDVESGSSLSEALSKHPKAFDKLYVNMVKAGEAGGVLDTILQRLATFMEQAQRLKRKVIGASIYPTAVISIAVLIVAGIMVFVIPQFQKVFKDMGVELPLLTQIILAISKLVAGYWFMIPALPLLIYVAIKFTSRNKQGKIMLDRLKLNVPLFGTIMRKATISRFCRTLGTLITSGVPILEALAIVKGAIGNEVISEAIQTVHDSIREGESIADPLAQCGVFDDIVINMIDVGEETGELDKMLVKIADNYDQEVDAAVEGLMSILEPVMIIGMGLTIGFIVIALFLPLIKLMDSMKS